MMTRKAPVRCSAAIGIFAASILALSGFQCAQVGDRATAPTGTGSDPNTTGGTGGVSACIQHCSDVANAARKTEQDLHHTNVAACNGNAQCLAQEEARHEAAMERISEDSDACKAGCHEQGSGSGGQ